MKIVRGGLIVASWVALFVLLTHFDWILEQERGMVLLIGILAGMVIGVGILISLLSSMYSSELSREEEADRNHAVPMDEYDRAPRGYKWS